MSLSQIVRIDTGPGARSFCAGLITVDGTVTEVAPILRWSVGKTLDHVLGYCRTKGWTVIVMEADDA